MIPKLISGSSNNNTMKDEEISQTIIDLNHEIFGVLNNDIAYLQCHSDGYCSHITFLGESIWNDDLDEREYIDDGYTQESLKDFLKREMVDQIIQLGTIKEVISNC